VADSDGDDAVAVRSAADLRFIDWAWSIHLFTFLIVCQARRLGTTRPLVPINISLVSQGKRTLVAILVIALIGVLVMLRATGLGIGISPDSVIYLDAGRNLAQGRGLIAITGRSIESSPLTHYPPLYPASLALISKTGVTLETAARWLNAILFGTNIFLVGLALMFCARNSFWLPVLGAFLTLTAPDILASHSVALTEPLYVALTLGGVLLLASYLQNGGRRLLLMAAILIAASCLTRYVGLATIGAGAIALLILERSNNKPGRFALSFRNESFRRRVVDALIFVAACCLSMAVLAIRNALKSGAASDRELVFHPVKSQQIVAAFSTMAQWLLVGKVRVDLRFIAFIIQILVMAGLTIFVMSKRRAHQNDGREAGSKLPHVLIIFIAAYLILWLVTMTFLEADDVLDSRSLLPVHFAALVLGLWLTRQLYDRALKAGPIRISFLVLALLLAGSYTFRGARWLKLVKADGQGYASRSWRESPTMAEIRKLPAAIPVYTNAIDAVYYLSGRRALDLPPRIIRGTGRPNQQYENDVERMKTDIQAHNGVLVYFHAFPERWVLPSESELRSRLPFEVVTLSDGSIFLPSSPRSR